MHLIEHSKRSCSVQKEVGGEKVEEERGVRMVQAQEGAEMVKQAAAGSYRESLSGSYPPAFESSSQNGFG